MLKFLRDSKKHETMMSNMKQLPTLALPIHGHGTLSQLLCNP